MMLSLAGFLKLQTEGVLGRVQAFQSANKDTQDGVEELVAGEEVEKIGLCGILIEPIQGRWMV